jgi:hypothetical protein
MLSINTNTKTVAVKNFTSLLIICSHLRLVGTRLQNVRQSRTNVLCKQIRTNHNEGDCEQATKGDRDINKGFSEPLFIIWKPKIERKGLYDIETSKERITGRRDVDIQPINPRPPPHNIHIRSASLGGTSTNPDKIQKGFGVLSRSS